VPMTTVLFAVSISFPPSETTTCASRKGMKEKVCTAPWRLFDSFYLITIFELIIVNGDDRSAHVRQNKERRQEHLSFFY